MKSGHCISQRRVRGGGGGCYLDPKMKQIGHLPVINSIKVSGYILRGSTVPLIARLFSK